MPADHELIMLAEGARKATEALAGFETALDGGGRNPEELGQDSGLALGIRGGSAASVVASSGGDGRENSSSGLLTAGQRAAGTARGFITNAANAIGQQAASSFAGFNQEFDPSVLSGSVNRGFINALGSTPIVGEALGATQVERGLNRSQERLNSITNDLARFGVEVSPEQRQLANQFIGAQEIRVEKDREENQRIVSSEENVQRFRDQLQGEEAQTVTDLLQQLVVNTNPIGTLLAIFGNR